MYMKNISDEQPMQKKRESGIELFKIITMLVIIAHHYFVNSDLLQIERESQSLGINSIFLWLFGWGGKTGINCFVLITGYFMCRSKITVKKFLKLILEMEFYKIVLYIIFVLTDYQECTVKTMVKTILPIDSVATNFGPAYLILFLFIPFLNILINGMDKKQHQILMGLCIGVYTVLSTLNFKVVFNYVTWFSVIYIICAYLRIYSEKWFSNRKLWGIASIVMLLISWLSVIVLVYIGKKTGKSIGYYFVVDLNKALVLALAVCAFMFFKNLNIGYNKFINKIAASAFGVLLIHANSDAMRQWLWNDTLNNAGQYNSPTLAIYAICSVVGIYIVCTFIDMVRIRFIEEPFFLSGLIKNIRNNKR